MLQSGKEFSRQAFEKLTVDELRKICKGNGISYYENGKRLAKGPMIDKLMAATEVVNEDDTDNNKESVEKPAKKSNKKNKQPEQSVKTEEQIAAEEAERSERKKKYVEQAKVGMIVAFTLPSGKVISAAITRKSTKGRKFMVETKYGAEHKISFDDVLWVRTNKRWPKGIYLLFKQNKKVEVSEDGEEIS